MPDPYSAEMGAGNLGRGTGWRDEDIWVQVAIVEPKLSTPRWRGAASRRTLRHTVSASAFTALFRPLKNRCRPH